MKMLQHPFYIVVILFIFFYIINYWLSRTKEPFDESQSMNLQPLSIFLITRESTRDPNTNTLQPLAIVNNKIIYRNISAYKDSTKEYFSRITPLSGIFNSKLNTLTAVTNQFNAILDEINTLNVKIAENFPKQEKIVKINTIGISINELKKSNELLKLKINETNNTSFNGNTPIFENFGDLFKDLLNADITFMNENIKLIENKIIEINGKIVNANNTKKDRLLTLQNLDNVSIIQLDSQIEILTTELSSLTSENEELKQSLASSLSRLNQANAIKQENISSPSQNVEVPRNVEPPQNYKNLEEEQMILKKQTLDNSINIDRLTETVTNNTTNIQDMIYNIALTTKMFNEEKNNVCIFDDPVMCGNYFNRTGNDPVITYNPIKLASS